MKIINIFLLLNLILLTGCLSVKKNLATTDNIVTIEKNYPTQNNNSNIEDIKVHSTVGCYYLQNEFPLDGTALKSCTPEYIQNMILEKYPYGIVLIWQFLNDHEILRTQITSKTLKSYGTNDSSYIDNYVKKGKILTETKKDGCQLINEIIEDKPKYIVLKHKGSKHCNEGVTKFSNSSINQNFKFSKVTD